MKNETNKKEELSKEELVASLNDPKALVEAAAKIGMRLTPVQAEAIEEEIKEKEMKFDLPENATLEDVVKMVREALGNQKEYFNKVLESKTQKVTKYVDTKETDKLRKEVQEFAKGHKHFEKILEDVEAFWMKGKTLEESYEKACKANGLDPQEKPEVKVVEGEEKSAETPDKPLKKSSPKVSEEAGEEKPIKKAPKSIEEASKIALSELLAKDPDALKEINGEE